MEYRAGHACLTLEPTVSIAGGWEIPASATTEATTRLKRPIGDEQGCEPRFRAYLRAMERVCRDRLRQNEEAFAAANEQIRDAAIEHRVEPVPFLCECSATNCVELIQVPLAAYREVRASGGFMIVPGHDDPHVEHVIGDHQTYQVVEKFRSDDSA